MKRPLLLLPLLALAAGVFAQDPVGEAFHAKWERLALPAFEQDAFSAFLYREIALANPTGNLVVATDGAASAIALLATGADQKSREALDDALNLSNFRASQPSRLQRLKSFLLRESPPVRIVDQYATADDLGALFRLLGKRRAAVAREDGAAAPSRTLALGLAPGRVPDSAFVRRARRDFGIEIRPLAQTGSAPASASEPLAEISVDDRLRLFWDAPVGDDVRVVNGTFRTTGGPVSARFLERTGSFLALFGQKDWPGYSQLLLPLQGGNLEAVVILPDEGRSLAEVEKSFDPTFVNPPSLVEVPERMTVVLPAFSLASRSDDLLAAAMSASGNSAHLPADSDFSALAGPGATEPPALVHAGALSLDPGKTPASPPSSSAPLRFVADRPFLFVVRDARIGLVLFIARIVAPATPPPRGR